MVQGLHLGDVSVYRKDVYEEIHRIRRDWNQSWGDMFFQCACSDVVHALSSTQAKKEETMQHIHTQQTYQDAQFLERYDLQPSRREHMP